MEPLVAVDRRGEIAGRVERRAVALLQQHRRLVLLVGQVDDQRALRLLGADGAGDLVDHRVHLPLVAALALVVLEGDPEPGVDLLEVAQRGVAELLPERERVGVVRLHPPEEVAGALVERGLLLGAGVRLDVDLDQVRGVALPRRVAVLLEADRDEAELLAPVAEVVDPLDPVALRPVEVRERVADHRRADVVERDRLGDVRRRVVDRHRLPRAGVGAAVAQVLATGDLEHLAGERLGLEARVHVRAGRLHREPGDGELAGDLGGDRRGRLLERLGEGEGGEREVAVRGLGGLDLALDLGGAWSRSRRRSPRRTRCGSGQRRGCSWGRAS